MNKLQPNSVRKINRSAQNWHQVGAGSPACNPAAAEPCLQPSPSAEPGLCPGPSDIPHQGLTPLSCPQLENLSNFIKAMASYGMNPVDLFEANDLFESGNLTQVQVSLLALAGMVSAWGQAAWEGAQPRGDWLGGPPAQGGAHGTPQLPLPWEKVGCLGPPSFLTAPPRQAKTKGMQSGVDIGVKYSEKQQRNFDEAKMKAGQCVIGLQVGWPHMCSPGLGCWVRGPWFYPTLSHPSSQLQTRLGGLKVP